MLASYGEESMVLFSPSQDCSRFINQGLALIDAGVS